MKPSRHGGIVLSSSLWRHPLKSIPCLTIADWCSLMWQQLGRMWELLWARGRWGLLAGLKSTVLKRLKHWELWKCGKASKLFQLFQKWNPQLPSPALLLLWSEQGHQGRVPERSRSITCIRSKRNNRLMALQYLLKILQVFRYSSFNPCQNQANPLGLDIYHSSWAAGLTGDLITLEIHSSSRGPWKQDVSLQGPWTTPWVTIPMRVERGSQTIHVFWPCSILFCLTLPVLPVLVAPNVALAVALMYTTPLDLQLQKVSLNTWSLKCLCMKHLLAIKRSLCFGKNNHSTENCLNMVMNWWFHFWILLCGHQH